MTHCHLFIADLHLDSSRPHHFRALQDFCASKLKPGYCLYILGDLFEVWLGDDMDIERNIGTVQLLREQVESGVNLYLQRGNRDFLLSTEFCRQTGAKMLSDEAIISIHQQQVLLMHGDSLCTKDTDYQAVRQQVRSAQWQSDFLSQSPEQRMVLADQYRQQSKMATAQKQQYITDVCPHTVNQVMAKHQVKTLIHGHTHRPMVHQLNGSTRIVLGDWRGHFDYLYWPDNDTWHFLRQSI